MNKTNFNQAILKNLPLPEKGKRAYFYDLKQASLRLDVMPSGRKTFQVYVKHEGRPVTITLGRFNPELADNIGLPRGCSHVEYLAKNPELNIRCARELAARVLIDLKSGVNQTKIKKDKRAELTLGELFEEYVSRHLAPHNRGVKSARSYFELYVGTLPDREPAPGKKKREKLPGCVDWNNRRISSITTDEIQRLVAGLATKGGSINNANKVLTLLKSMFARAREWGVFAGDNPTNGISKFRTKSRERFLQPEEIPRFFYSLSEEPSQDIRDLFLIALLTGARKSNVEGMRWDDIHFERALWVIPEEVSKNGEPLSIPLVPEVSAHCLEAR